MYRPFLCAIALLLACRAHPAGAQQVLNAPRADGGSTALTLYEPAAAGKTCAPLLLISHGAGGSEKAMPYLGQALSADGWRVLVLGHRESGLEVLRADLRQAGGVKSGIVKLITDAGAYRARFLDIGAALAFAEQRCHAPYKVLLGHSMGAITVMLEAGANNLLGLKGQQRFDAYVALSPEGVGPVFPAGAWKPVKAPMLLLTGTRDAGIAGDYRWRTQSYDGLSPGCRWLGVIDGATHGNFAGSGDAGTTEAITTRLVTDFLDARRAGRCATPPTLVGVSLQTK